MNRSGLAVVVAFVGLVVSAMPVHAGPAVEAELTAVIVARTDDGVRVTLRATGPVVADALAAVSATGSRPRIVLNLPAVAPGRFATRVSGMDDLGAVQIAARPDGSTHVQLELERSMTWRLRPQTDDRTTLMIDLVAGQPRSIEAAAAMATPAAIAQTPRAPIAAPRPTSTTPTAPAPAPAQAAATPEPRPYGRASFYAHAARVDAGDVSRSFAELTSAITYQLPDRGGDGLEYGLDLRHSGYTLQGRRQRLSIYDGFVGQRLLDGTLGVRGGHMWLSELGGLGAFAGGLVEMRQGAGGTTPVGRWRAGGFHGLEPQNYEAGYADDVRKSGGYVVFDGDRSRQHVVGYVNVRHGSVTERSALSFTNYMPIGKLSIFQSGEYDLSGPGGAGDGGLSYFFTNARATVHPRVELLGTFSRGRSIDARGISDDVLNGRPVPQRSIEGLLYRTIGGRATVEIMPRVRAYAGYSRDRNNRDDADTGRWLLGGYANNVADTGLDVAVSDSRLARPGGSYHSTYLSVGRQVGRLYVTGDFTTSLALVRFVRGDGVVIEQRPETRRFGGSGVMTLTRTLTLHLSAEQTLDADADELRVMTGLTVRLR